MSAPATDTPDAATEQGLSSAEAAKRLRKLGPPPDTSSRSISSIVAGNVFTLFNAIIGVFFVLILSLGLIADAVFGLIAIVNSYIGIRQELKAKRTLDELAVLVAPHAKALRDGAVVSLLAEEVVPGDVVAIEPGDQLVADGEAISSRGMTLDESLLTGEADGVRKEAGERVLSGSFCISGSGRYVVDAVREESYAGRLAGEAKAFRHPPSPLQGEVNRVIVACTWAMAPLAAAAAAHLPAARHRPGRGGADRDRRPGDADPRGAGAADERHLRRRRGAAARRKDTLVQQMSATESLAAVDTICVDKTGTLTDGELRLLGVEVAEGVDPDEATGGAGALRGERRRPQPDPGDDRRGLPGDAGPGRRRGALLLESGSGAGCGWAGSATCSARRTSSPRAGALELPPGLARKLAEETAAGRRVVAFGESGEPLPDDPAQAPPPRLTPLALVVLEETLRADAAETIATMREEDVDLKLISGDARATVTAVAYAVGVPADAGVIEGSELPEDPEGLAAAARRNTIFCRIAPEQKKALVEALRASGRYTAMIGDGVNDVPALKQARLAVAMGSGAQVTKGIADVVLLEGRVRATAGSGRRGAADRPQHPPPRPPLPDQVASTRRR